MACYRRHTTGRVDGHSVAERLRAPASAGATPYLELPSAVSWTAFWSVPCLPARSAMRS